MRFPSLEVMIKYGIYTVRELERFAKGLVPKKKINILSECTKCSFVYSGISCTNCHSWGTAPSQATCQKDLKLSAIITCAQSDNSLGTCIENVWKKVINPINLLNGCIGNTVSWLSRDKIYMVMLYHFRVSYVGKLWKGWTLGGKLTMGVSGSIVV